MGNDRSDRRTLLRNLSHHMLTYFTSHNHLKTVLITKQPKYEVLQVIFGQK